MTYKPYPTDLSDSEWLLLQPLLPSATPGGRPRTTDLRSVCNALFYWLATGCAWRMLPHDFPPHQTVYEYFRAWQRAGTWEHVNTTLRRQVRLAAGHDAEPSAAILDSQSAKTSAGGGESGYDAGKKVKGRKRHLVVDTLGLVLLVVVHVASIQDRDGAKRVLKQLHAQRPRRLQLLWADGGYAGQLVAWVQQTCGWVLEIVKRSDKQVGFVLLKRRWIVERTFGWLSRYRRLSKDYEVQAVVSEAVVYAAMGHVMLRRLSQRAGRQKRKPGVRPAPALPGPEAAAAA